MVGEPLRRLERARRELSEELESLAVLRPVAARTLALEDLVDDLDRQLARASDAAVVVLVGSTGAGKSTLLNALAGADIARTGTERPTTSHPTIYAPRDADLGPLTAELPLEARVVRFDPRPDAPASAHVLVDAPDTNSIETAHREVVEALVERADVLVVVEHRQSILERSTVEFLERFAGRRALVGVLNRADELTADARRQLLEQLRQLLLERLGAGAEPRIHAVSAAEAREGRGGAGFETLVADLEDLAGESRLAGVRRHNALGVAAAIAGLADGARRELGERLVQLPAAAREGLGAWIDGVEQEVLERLQLARADLAGELAGEAGRRWDGPGGWALRAGGASALGAGLGLALARRHPALAAGSALGGALVGRARQEIGRRRLADASTLLPEGDSLRAAFARHLGGVRVSAGAIASDLSRLGLPECDELESQLERAVDDAWRRLVNKRLPEAAQRAVHPVWRFLLDLPVIGLLLVVLQRAITGFWSGEYVGIDFVVNSVLLAFAAAFVVRTGVRAYLAARARRLLRGVGDDLAASIREVGQGALERVERCTAELEERLSRLGRLDDRWREALERNAETGSPASTVDA